MPRPFAIALGLAASVALAGLFSIASAGPRAENTTMATPVNVYGSQGVPLKQTNDAGTIGVEVTGGAVSISSISVSDAQVPIPVRESGYPSAAQRCFDVVCSTVGDGGVLGVPPDGGAGSMLVTGRRYVSTVTTDSPVRVRNGGACVAFTAPTGVGRILNEGSTVDFVAQAAPDGGVPFYSCCAKTAGATWNLCEQ